jgi:hypothetical protein
MASGAPQRIEPALGDGNGGAVTGAARVLYMVRDGRRSVRVQSPGSRSRPIGARPRHLSVRACSRRWPVPLRAPGRERALYLCFGQFIPGADFDAVGYHPSLYSLDTGNIAAAAFTNPFAKFPLVAALGASAEPDPELNTEAFKHCVDVYRQASGQTVQSQLQEDVAGKSSGNVAMQIACTTLQIFVAGAKAAGANLNNQTLEKGIESIGKIELANGTVGSFGPNKLDGQDSFQLQKFDATWKQGEGKPQFIAIGQPVTLGG